MTSLLSRSGEQKLTPRAILDMTYAFVRTAILVASVHLHLFTHLANQALTPVELAACTNTVPEPRTVSEVARWLAESGLRDVQPFHVTGPFPTVIARKGEEA